MRRDAQVFGAIAAESRAAAAVYRHLVDQSKMGPAEWLLNELAHDHDHLAAVAAERVKRFTSERAMPAAKIWNDIGLPTGVRLAQDEKALGRLRAMEQAELAACATLRETELSRDGKQFMDAAVIPLLKDHVDKLASLH